MRAGAVMGRKAGGMVEDIKTEVIATPTEIAVATELKVTTKPGSKKPIGPENPQPLYKLWFYIAVAYFGLLALLFLARIPGWIKEARERRIHTAVNSVTPESVISRCGQPAEDVTKDLYPMIARTMTYNPRGKAMVVLAFSRTAEENSDWVFMSMKDESGMTTYSTAETQIAALPCLDSSN